jgi:hypothetical protein
MDELSHAPSGNMDCSPTMIMNDPSKPLAPPVAVAPDAAGADVSATIGVGAGVVDEFIMKNAAPARATEQSDAIIAELII